MSQAIKEALASLRDSLARLGQRSFDDFALFQQVTAMQFRSNEVAKRLALLLTGGLSAPGDKPVALQLLTAGGKVSVAEPLQPATVRTALAAAGSALDATDAWIAAAGGAEAVTFSAPKTGSKPRAPRPPSSPPAPARSTAGKDRAPARTPAPRSRPGR